MRGLLLRLSGLDADAESAVRVIVYFDSLVRDHASVSVLLKATAQLAQCPVGLIDSVAGKGMRVPPGGAVELAAAGPPPSATSRPLGSALGTVWMEREGTAHGLDEIVLERFAGAAEVTIERAAALARSGDDPALVELALSAEAGEAERARALRLLGFGPATPLQVLATPADESQDGAALVASLRGTGLHARGSRMGEVAAIVVAPGVDVLPDGPRIGVGPAVTGAAVVDSWAGARDALRFTAPGPRDRVVRWADLGALALFAAYVPGEAIAGLPDVRALEDLARRPHGPEVMEAVAALCAEGSVRRAAVAAHLHHSSMAARIARAEAALGFSLADSPGRARAYLALSLVRLHAGGDPGVSGAVPVAARRTARRGPAG